MSEPKIMRWFPDLEEGDFQQVDYKKALPFRLARRETFVKGELTLIEYFASSEFDVVGGQVYSDLVVKEVISYTNVDKRPISRDIEIIWINEDETDNEFTKSLHKKYDTVASFNAALRRRMNIISFLQRDVVIVLMMSGLASTMNEAIATGQQLAGKYFGEITTFKELGAGEPLIHALQNDTTFTWLSVPFSPELPTVRDFVIDAVTI